MSRNVRYALIVLAVIIVWLLSGVFSNDDDALTKPEDENKNLTHVEAVSSEAVLYQPSISFNARTEPYRIVSLRAETEGPLIATDVAEGAEVETGTVVGQIDT